MEILDNIIRKETCNNDGNGNTSDDCQQHPCADNCQRGRAENNGVDRNMDNVNDYKADVADVPRSHGDDDERALDAKALEDAMRPLHQNLQHTQLGETIMLMNKCRRPTQR